MVKSIILAVKPALLLKFNALLVNKEIFPLALINVLLVAGLFIFLKDAQFHWEMKKDMEREGYACHAIFLKEEREA